MDDDINIIEFSEVIEKFYDWKKLKIIQGKLRGGII